MRYHDPQVRSALAGEYVLGTLHGAARRRFERLLDQDPVLRGEVVSWEAMLSPLTDALPERAPPNRVWQAISGRVGGPVSRPEAGLWESLRFWRAGGLLAAACALVLAVALAVQLAREPDIRYVAVVVDGQDRSAWLVAAQPRSAKLEVRNLRPQEISGDRSFELWLLPPEGGSPRSLGLLAPEGESTRALSPRDAKSLPIGAGLAVSLEPRGGSPTGQPTGPVLYQGRLLRL